jgi:hypothetical protein
LARDRVKGGPTIPHFVLSRITHDALVEGGRELAYRVASRIAGQVRDMIIRQTNPDWPPLSRAYARHKEVHGLDSRMLIATGAYVRSIVARRHGMNAFTVAPSEDPLLDSHGVPTGYTLTDLGTWLEFGTRNPDGSQKMPPRPHWRPVLDDFSKDKTAIEMEIRSKIKEEVSGTLQGRRSQARRTHAPRAPLPGRGRRRGR